MLNCTQIHVIIPILIIFPDFIGQNKAAKFSPFRYVSYNIQVCLMSQSLDNVANMHELLTVSSHTQKKSKQYHLPSCMSTVSTVCMSSTNFEPISITS